MHLVSSRADDELMQFWSGSSCCCHCSHTGAQPAPCQCFSRRSPSACHAPVQICCWCAQPSAAHGLPATGHHAAGKISVDVIHKYNCCKFSKCTPSGYSTLNAVVLINFFIIINFISPLPKWGSDFRTWHSYVLLNKQKVIQVFMTNMGHCNSRSTSSGKSVVV